MSAIKLRKQELRRFRKEYGSQLTYLFADLVGGIESSPELYEAPHFDKHLPWKALDFAERVFPNLRLIVEAIENNIPRLSRIEAQLNRLNIAFCRNLWLHDLLLDDSWQDEAQKRDYLNYAFQAIFRQFDTKVCANFDIEFLPYDMPWAAISSISPLDEEQQWRKTQSQYSKFYQPKFLSGTAFSALTRKTLRADEDLYYALRITNQLRDHRKRTFYFDLNQFALYAKFSKILKENQDASAIAGELKRSLLYYEFKRSMIWNAAFLLKANEFRTLIDSLRGQPFLEGLIKAETSEQDQYLRKILRETKQIENKQLEANKAEKASKAKSSC